MPDSKNRGKILIIDDEIDLLVSCQKILKRTGHNVEIFERAVDGIEWAKENDLDVLLVDLKMPGITGFEVLDQVKKFKPTVPVIIITAFATVETAVVAIKKGAFDYLAKPFSPGQLEVIVNRAIGYHKLQQENVELKARALDVSSFFGIIGKSKPITDVFHLIQKISKSAASVLILGESGTGKELVARAIHSVSSRSNGEFVTVDCAGLPGNLIESELFGYEKGAFTGATSQRDGLLKLSDGGTVFLDELGELDVLFQTKLLRFLQERQFRPVGANRVVSVDVRVLCATNRDLKKEISQGRFREDLYHRVNVIPVSVPPLRDRLGDVQLLVEYFLGKFTEENHNIEVTPEVWALLMSYHWPGNVRELQNVIERAVSLCSNDRIEPGDLPPAVLGSGRGGLTSQGVPTELPYKEARSRWLEPFERDYLIDLLRRAGKNVTHAAATAKIDRKSIQRMMKKYRIRLEDL